MTQQIETISEFRKNRAEADLQPRPAAPIGVEAEARRPERGAAEDLASGLNELASIQSSG